MKCHNYITIKRAKFKGIDEEFVNIPFGTELQVQKGFVMHNGRKICSINSKNGRDFFAINDDGNGLQRGMLINAIKKALASGPNKSAESNAASIRRWDRVWGSLMCKRYKHPGHDELWIWNQDFYGAPIEDLKSIANLVEAEVKA